MAEGMVVNDAVFDVLSSRFLNLKTGYEAGSFVPTYYGSTTPGTTTYTIQAGRYVRIGALVSVWGRVAWSAATGTGQAVIGGLPIAVVNATNLIIPLTLWGNGITWSGTAGTMLMPRANAGGTTITLEYGTTNAGISAILIEAAGDFAFSLSYPAE